MKNKEFFIRWLKAAGCRAIKTVAEAAIATIGTAMVMGEVNWAYVASASALAGVMSVLFAIKGLPEVKMPEITEEE